MKEKKTETDQSQEEAQHRVNYLETLSTVASAVSGVLQLEQVLKIALDKAMEVSKADKGVIHLLDAANQELVLHIHQGLSSEYLRAYERLKVGEHVAGGTAQTGQPVIIEDSTTDPQATPEVVKTERYRSLICLPLRARQDILGTIAMLSANPKHFTSADVQLLTAVAQQIAISIESARLFEEKERRVSELAALNEIGQAIASTLNLTQVLKLVAQKAAQVCNVERCNILLLDKDKKELVPMMSQFASGVTDLKLWRIFKEETYADKVDDVPATREVIRERRTVILDEESRSRLPQRWTQPFGIKSLLLVPLTVRDESIGLMALDYTTEGRHFSTEQISLATTIGGQVAIAIENARLYGETERRLKESDTLQEISRLVNSSLEPGQIFQTVVETIASAFGYSFVSIYILDREELRLRSQVGYDPADVLYFIPLDKGVSGRVARSGEAELIPDVSQDPDFLQAAPGIVSEITVPIKKDDLVLGTLTVESTASEPLSEADLNLISSISHQVSVAIQNARLYERERKKVAQLQAINRAGQEISSLLHVDEMLSQVVRLLQETFDCYNANVFLIDDNSLFLAAGCGGYENGKPPVGTTLGLGEGITGWVAEHGEPLLVSDVSLEPRYFPYQELPETKSELAVPIETKERILGVLDAQSTKLSAFDQTDLEALCTLADQLSIGIDNARLYDESQRRLRQSELLRTASEAVASTLDLTEVLTRIAEQMGRSIDATSAYIDSFDSETGKSIALAEYYGPEACPEERASDLGQTYEEWDDEFVSAMQANQYDIGHVDDPELAEIEQAYMLQYGAQSILYIPLRIREELIGYAEVWESRRRREFTPEEIALCRDIARSAAIAIENARLYERERKRAAQLGVINEVGRRASSILLLDELLQETVAAIQESFNYHFVSILVVNEDRHEVEQKAEVGRHDYMQAPGYRQSIDEGLIGWVARNGEPLMANDVGKDTRYLEGFPTRPFTKAELVVPIKLDGKVVSVLDIQSAELNAFEQTDLMSMQTITDQLSVAMQNARLYEEIKEHSTDLEATNRRLMALQDVSASLAGTLDLQEVLQKVVSGVVKGLGYSVAGVAIINERKGVAENMVFSGVDPSLLKRAEHIAGLKIRDASLPLDDTENLAIRTLNTGEILVTDSLYGVLKPMMGQRVCNTIQKLLNLKTIVAVPLLVEDKPVGGLLALLDKAEATEQELASLLAFANQGALAIHNAKLYERTEKRLEELSTLHEISIAATSTLDFTEILERIVVVLQRTLGFTNMSLMLFDEEEQRLRIRAGMGYKPEVVERVQPRLGEGITGWVALTGEPQNVPDVAKDPRYIVGDETVRSELCVPLQVGNRIIGVLNIESTQLAAFSDDDLRFLSTLAGQMAVIIENARLFQQVAQGEKEWEDTFEAITDGIAIYDTDLRILRTNPALAEILATTHEELIGKRCYEIFSYCYGLTDASCPHRRAMEMREPTSIEVEEPGLNKILHIFSFPIFDEEGNFKGTVHTVRDITEQKQLRTQLLQTEKLAAIGKVVSGVAHELNNPLTSVMGYAQLLQTSDVSEEVKDDLRRIYLEAQRSAKIIESLLTFARKEKAQKRYVNINHILIDTLKLRSYQLRLDNVELIKELDEHLPWTMAAPHQLQQVFLNLINNAHQAMLEYQGEGSLTVRSDKDDQVIRVKVIDTGPGIPQEILGKIFDPFFTTKEIGQGTGLGLSIAFGIVQEHGGRISAESEMGKGTAFTVELPILQGPPEWPDKVPPTEKQVPYTGKRILVIDDEEEVLKLIIRILDRMGHQAVALASTEAALDLIDKEEYDLVISDVRMPGIGGQELYQQVKRRHPELTGRIIFITGDTISDSTYAFLQNVGNPHVTKPFMIEDLQQAVEEVLQREEEAS
jgi:two-component system NtrC family sensor kinase